MRIVLTLWAACAYAQSAIEVPSVGAIVDSSGLLRQVHGVAGNFFLEPGTVAGILSAECSERLCLAKTDSKILSPTGESGAPPGPAIFGIDGDGAVVYFPDTRTFAHWHDNTLEQLDWKVDGEVLSIRSTEVAVRREGRVWIIRPDGAVLDWIADTSGPVLLLSDGVLFAAPGELVLRRGDAGETRFGLPGAETLAAMGAHYAAIVAGGTTYTLRTEAGLESLYLLPATSP